MKIAYVRPTKLHPEAEQRAVLERVTPDEWYVDEKPKRGEPGWFFRDKIPRACRPGEQDEVYVSHPSVIADNVRAALEWLALLTERGATLVVMSTGQSYRWHPDALRGWELALEMEREARHLVAKIGGDARAKKAAEKREREAKRAAKIQRMWLDKTVPTPDVERFAGCSRDALYKRFGPRGTPRFIGVKKDDAS